MGFASTQLPHSWPKLGHFMRSQGVRWLYVLYVIWFSIVYVQLLTVDNTGAFSTKNYAPLKTAQISIFRMVGLVMFPLSLLLAAWFMLTRLPVEQLDPDAEFRTFPVESLTAGFEPSRRPHVPCVIVLIVTCGQYPKMIRRNATYHLTLLQRYLRCDQLEAHVVTERPLDGDYRVGSGWVRELVVPADYQTPNGTLFRARNVVYWLENGPTGVDYPPEDQTWLLAVDEDVFVTEGFVSEFARDFLLSDADTSTSLPLAFFDPSVSHASLMSEASTSVISMAFSWLEVDILKSQPIWFRGTAYVIRRDLDRKIGRDFGPMLSVTDDYVFGNYAAARNVKFRPINGWIYAGSAISNLNLVRQRARWSRGNFIALLHQKMPLKRKICITVLYCILNFVMTLGVTAALLYVANVCYEVFAGNSRSWDMLIVGPRVWYLDYITAFSVATWNWAVVYGSWLMLPSKRALSYTIGVYFLVLTFWGHIQHIIGFCWMVVSFTTDCIRGSQRLEITPKKDH